MAKKKVFSIGSALAQGLEETIESAQNYSSELRIDVIPISKIETDPENPRDLLLNFSDLKTGIAPSDIDRHRKELERDSLQSIAHSIKTQGIINPITVYKHGEKYRLIAGERRTLASLLAGKSDIQAKIIDSKPDSLKISLLQWIENIERSDLSLWERLKNLEKIVETYAANKGIECSQITLTDLSSLIGCSKSNAMNYKNLLYADDNIKQLIMNDKIRNLEKAALIANIQSQEVKQEAIKACINGATLKQIKAIIDEANRKPVVQKLIEKRGRQTTRVNFGSTKNLGVAKVIFESILNHSAFSHLKTDFQDINWRCPRSVANDFRRLLKNLEKLNN